MYLALKECPRRNLDSNATELSLTDSTVMLLKLKSSKIGYLENLRNSGSFKVSLEDIRNGGGDICASLNLRNVIAKEQKKQSEESEQTSDSTATNDDQTNPGADNSESLAEKLNFFRIGVEDVALLCTEKRLILLELSLQTKNGNQFPIPGELCAS